MFFQYSKVESGDQTDVLQAGYWPSYNVPFYEDIFRSSGYAEMVAKFGNDLSYQLCHRAKIFRRDQGNVSMKGETPNQNWLLMLAVLCRCTTWIP